MTADLELLRSAVASLAGVCDYAQEEDGRGFNKPDAGIGHRLAELPVDLWTAEEARDIHGRIGKYRGQLESFGIDYRTIPRPELPADRPIDWDRRLGAIRRVGHKGATLSGQDRAHEARRAREADERRRADQVLASRKLTLDGTALRLAYPFDPRINEALRAVPGRKRWDGAARSWIVPLDGLNIPLFRTFLRAFPFDISEAADAELEDRNRSAVERAARGEVATVAPARLVDLAEDGSALLVHFDYDRAILEALKAAAPAARWDKKATVWRVALRYGSVEGLAGFAQMHGFTVTPGALEAMARVGAAHVERIAESRLAAGDFDSLGIADKLAPTDRPRPFQVAGIAYGLKTKRLIIGDDMGLGKTVQGLLIPLAADAFPIAVVCPASLVYNWYKEARKWLRGKTITVLRPGKPGAYRADVVIINYDILTMRAPVRRKGETDGEFKARGGDGPKPKKGEVLLSKHARGLLEANPRTVIFDEFHYCKSYKAQRTIACRELAKGREFRIGLTGTPIENKHAEFLSLLQIIGRLDDLGGFFYFARHYCGADTSGGGKFGMDLSRSINAEDLNRKLRATCYVRREKADVLPELPAKTRQTIELDIDNRKEYAAAERDVSAWVRASARNDVAFLERLEKELELRRRELTLGGQDAAAVDQAIALEREDRITAYENQRVDSATRASALVKIEALKQIAARGKMGQALEWTLDFVDQKKAIIFARHVALQEEILAALQAAGVKTARIFGDDDPAVRQANVDAFQTDPTVRAIVVSLDAGGVGWTGTAASDVIFFELGWTSGKHDQAEDRAHRIGQHDAVTAWYLVAKGTIEEDIVELIEGKRELVAAATIGGRDVAGSSVLAGAIRRLAAGRSTVDEGAEEVELVF